MKIGLVLSKTPSYSETFFVSKIKGLQKNGFDITLFVQTKNKMFDLCEVKVAPKVYKRNVLYQFFKSTQVLLKLALRPVQVITFIRLERNAGRSVKQLFKNMYNNSHILTSNLDWLHFGFITMALQSEHVAKTIGAKMAVSFRGFDIDVYPLKNKKSYNLIWKNVNKIHTLSNYLLEKAYELELPNSVKHQIITPAIDISNFKKKTRAKNNILQIITVARLHWMKGLNYTLEGLALLKSKNITFNYKIIGDGSEFESLSFAIHQLKLQDHVQLIRHRSQEEIIEYLSNSDIYIQYSHSEGFCNAVLEAQAMGLLCIVSDGGGLRENIVDGETGWVVCKRSPLLLAKKIVEVIHLPDSEKKRVSNNAINRVQTTFNIEKQEEAFLKFYE